MAIDEYTIVTRILRELKAHGAKAVNIHVGGFTTRGTPDILGVYRGRAFAIEVKNDEGESDTRQKYEQAQWSKAGAVVMEARSWSEVQEQVIDVIDSEHRNFQ